MLDNDAIVKSKQRDTNLELFRIITMLLIVAHHYVVNSGLMEVGGPIESNPLCFKSIFLLIFGAWGKAGINGFVLITGYFMCKSHITVKKIIKLLVQIYFYKIIIYLIFLISGYDTFGIKDFIKVLLPVTKVSDNFIGCFLIFYLLIPFINILISNLSEKLHLRLLLILLFVYVIIGSIPVFVVSFNYLSWFFVIYLTASYIRLYPKAIYEKNSFWIWICFLTVVLSGLSIIGFAYIGKKLNLFNPYYFLADSNKIFAYMTALSSFMVFKNLKIKYNKFINLIASGTFGVLLIHANSNNMRNWLWGDLLHNVQMYDSKYLFIHAILSVIVIYMVCTIIDILRNILFDKMIFKRTK